MKKYICTCLVLFLLFIGSPVYAACNHQYVKEYNYSSEVPKIVDKHCYRMKCSLCGEIQVSSKTMYENCSYSNKICMMCGEKHYIQPKYNINLNPELQTYLYDLCIKNDVLHSYEYLITIIYKNSNFDSKLENESYKGLFQLNAGYDYSSLIGRNNYDLLNEKDNLEIGVALYKFYYELNNNYVWPAIIGLDSGMISKDMKEFKNELDLTTNVKNLLEISQLSYQLKQNGSL